MKKIIIFMIGLFLYPNIFFTQNQDEKFSDARIDIIYFHATVRCQSCLTIEEFTRNSVNSSFEKELKDSSITLTVLDFQDEKNEHFQDDYKFETQTLIISKKIDGKEVKWKNLEKIWDYMNNYEKFRNYITAEVKDFIK